MAIKYYEKYPQRWESPSNDYPQGAFKNLSAIGENDGSYLEKDWLNDYSGFFGALLHNAEMTPNGLIDTAQKSQFYEALLAIIPTLSSSLNSTSEKTGATSKAVKLLNDNKQDKLTFIGTGDTVNKSYVDEQVENTGGLPIGHIYWGLTLDIGSLALNGAKVSRTTYSELWNSVSGSAISQTAWDNENTLNGMCGKFGQGDGVNTFTLPNINGYVKGGGTGYQKAGLPNITGTTGVLYRAIGTASTGALTISGYGNTPAKIGAQGADPGDNVTIELNASHSSAIYGTSDTVEVNSIRGVYQVKAFSKITNVGNVDIEELLKAKRDLTDNVFSNSTIVKNAQDKRVVLNMSSGGSGEIRLTQGETLLHNLTIPNESGILATQEWVRANSGGGGTGDGGTILGQGVWTLWQTGSTDEVAYKNATRQIPLNAVVGKAEYDSTAQEKTCRIIYYPITRF